MEPIYDSRSPSSTAGLPPEEIVCMGPMIKPFSSDKRQYYLSSLIEGFVHITSSSHKRLSQKMGFFDFWFLKMTKKQQDLRCKVGMRHFELQIHIYSSKSVIWRWHTHQNMRQDLLFQILMGFTIISYVLKTLAPKNKSVMLLKATL